MIEIIIKIVICQFVFLLIYETLLKRETFFQWNRVYLIATSILSVAIPFLKINWIERQIPSKITTSINEIVLYASQSNEVKSSSLMNESPNSVAIPWEIILISGSILFFILLIRKFYQIKIIKNKSKRILHLDFTEYIIPNSYIAFSFINSIFIGDKISQTNYNSIINHEMVHIKQKHSYDLIYFELLKMLFWYNPFVYLYQRYSSEVHEFIADQETNKNQKNYEALLNQAFEIENFTFSNQFFNQSLIKKRIVMLKKNSKKSNVIKYLMVAPLTLLMLVIFNSKSLKAQESSNISDEELKEKIYQKVKQKHENDKDYEYFLKESSAVFSSATQSDLPLSKEDFYISIAYLKLLMEKAPAKNEYQKKKNEEVLEASKNTISYEQYLENFKNKKSNTVNVPKNPSKFELPEVKIKTNEVIPFMDVDQAPLFDSCAITQTKDCFVTELNNNIRKNFHYPEEAIKNKIEGRVFCNLIITKEGDFKILELRGPDPILERSVYELLQKFPKVKPAIHKGQPAIMSFSIPISYKLTE